MDPRDALKNLSTGDVEIGFNPLKRRVAEVQGWICERCGAAKTPAGEKQPCTSKSGQHKWRKA